MLKTVLLVAMFCVAFGANPFDGQTYYVNPSFQRELDTSIATATGTTKETLQSMRNVGSAYWLDVKAKIHGDTTDTLEGILKDAATKSPAPMVVFIVYDLPNRDCNAKASNGEICCTKNADGTCNYQVGGDCSAGLNEYKTEYIDPIANVLKQYDGKVPMALIIEPDSLPNLVTNQGNPNCGGATSTAYKIGIPYAITTLSTAAPSAAIYVDAAHGGWLGWQHNAVGFAQLFAQLNIHTKIRGFSTNVANYQTLGKVMCKTVGYCMNNAHPTDPCCYDPCKLISQWNFGQTELNYVGLMNETFQQYIPGFQPQFIVDTGRNGVGDMRQRCANWCNIRGAGVGLKPTAETAHPLIDAYLWLKTPGESDGCTQLLPEGGKCARFDSMCASEDSIGSKQGEPRAPEAGRWFDYQIKMLAENAHL